MDNQLLNNSTKRPYAVEADMEEKAMIKNTWIISF
jgi:hypothetical protein